MGPLEDDKPKEESNPAKKIAIIASICAAPILLLIACIWLRRVYLHVRLRLAVRRLKLPTTPYPPGGVATEEDSAYATCVICVEAFAAGEEVAVLPCTHLFHPSCVRTQVRKELNPRCEAPML